MALGDGVAVSLGDSGVVLPAVDGLLGLLGGCVLGAEPVGDPDAGPFGTLVGSGAFGELLPVGAVGDPGNDGLDGVPLPDVPGTEAVPLGVSGCRICAICCSYRSSCARISARL